MLARADLPSAAPRRCGPAAPRVSNRIGNCYVDHYDIKRYDIADYRIRTHACLPKTNFSGSLNMSVMPSRSAHEGMRPRVAIEGNCQWGGAADLRRRLFAGFVK